MSRDLGIEISETQLDLFSIYLEELWNWNRKINLTGLSSIELVIRELVLDSLMASPFLPDAGKVLDIGSGAGFPAIPLKIHNPLLEMHLFEAHRKKSSFLKHAIRQMKLSGMQVLEGRIESDNFLLDEEGYGAVTARAVTGLACTLKWSVTHVRRGGVIINFQGANFKKALDESSHVMSDNQIELESSVPYRLPGRNLTRTLLIFRKT